MNNIKNKDDGSSVDLNFRKKKINTYLLVIAIFFVAFIGLLTLSVKLNKTNYVGYNEKHLVDYKVYLKDNEFYEDEYLQENHQYISTLIDYIIADFSYDLSMNEENVNFEYKYRVVAEVSVKEKTSNNVIYSFDENIIEEKRFSSDGVSSIHIYESVEVEYNKYNNLIKRFINVYDLENSISTLNVKMYVNVIGECETF